jgi:hypothetical protein
VIPCFLYHVDDSCHHPTRYGEECGAKVCPVKLIQAHINKKKADEQPLSPVKKEKKVYATKKYQ